MYHKKKEKDEDEYVEDPVEAVHYKEKESRHQQMERNKQVKIIDDYELEINWQDNAHIGEQYVANSVTKVLTYLPNWNRCETGVFGRMVKAKKRIKPTSQDVRPFNSAPCCVGPKAGEFENSEIY